MTRLAQKLPIILLMGAFLTYTGCKKDEETPMPILTKPVIESVAPSEGTIGTEIAIKGLSFLADVKVYVGAQQAAQVEVVDEGTVFAIVPAGIAVDTWLPVRVVNTDGGEISIENAFRTIAPVLGYVNSATKPSGNIGSTVILEGNAFGDVQGEGQVLFSDGLGGTIAAQILNAEDWTNTFIVTTVPQGAQDGDVVIKTQTGTSNVLPFDVAASATFSPSTISWKLTTALPTAVSGHQALYAPIDDANGITNQYVYITGGRTNDGASVNQALVGQIGTDGSIATWTATSPLPEVRSSHATVAATPFNSKVKGSGFVYVMGGINASNEPVNTVTIGTLNNDGTVSSWSQGLALPQALHSLGAVIFRNNIYIAGGATTGNTAVATVYKAQLDTLGQIAAWEELGALPAARAHHGFVTFGGFLYAVGGDTGATTVDDANFTSNESKLSEVLYAKINIRTGSLTTAGWSVNPNAMSKARSKHTTLVAGGSIFVSSGLYSGAGNGSSENTYGQINSDGTIASFNGATGSNTLFSTAENHLFNQSGISYVDANGVARVMIIGGDDVKAPGTKQSDVIYY